MKKLPGWVQLTSLVMKSEESKPIMAEFGLDDTVAKYASTEGEFERLIEEPKPMMPEFGIGDKLAKYPPAESEFESAIRWADHATSLLQKFALLVLVAFVFVNGLHRFGAVVGWLAMPFNVGTHFRGFEIWRTINDVAHSRDHDIVPNVPCKEYTYKQCERLIIHYLEQGANHRCEAFESVKAQGDYFKYPNSVTKQASTTRCDKPGCCGCPGQCSACPAVLPECVSWRLVGEWKVTFEDGNLAKYTFDAKGNVEAELPSKFLLGHGQGQDSSADDFVAVAGTVIPIETDTNATVVTGLNFYLSLDVAAPGKFAPRAINVFTLDRGNLWLEHKAGRFVLIGKAVKA